MKAKILLLILGCACLVSVSCSGHKEGPVEKIGKGIDQIFSGASDYSEKQAERDAEYQRRYPPTPPPYYYDDRDSYDRSR